MIVIINPKRKTDTNKWLSQIHKETFDYIEDLEACNVFHNIKERFLYILLSKINRLKTCRRT